MPFDDDDAKKVFIALLGAIGGAALLQSHHDEKRKSQAEKDDPEGTKWICEMVGGILDHWHPPDYEREDEYTEHLFHFLKREIGETLEDNDPDDVRLEMRTGTSHGIPDILIHDRLVLELKVASKKSERDRLVGQCCEYSRGYVTWAIVIDWPDDRIDKLVDLLEAKSLNYISVIPFDLDEDDEEDDG